ELRSLPRLEGPVERTILLLQPDAKLLLQDAELSVGDVLAIERPEEVRVFVNDLQPHDGGLVDQPLAGPRAGREQQRLPPGAVALLELSVEEQGRERVLLAVVAVEPRQPRCRPEPEREVDREVAVNAFGLHRLDYLEGAQHGGPIDFALLIEHGAMDA